MSRVSDRERRVHSDQLIESCGAALLRTPPKTGKAGPGDEVMRTYRAVAGAAHGARPPRRGWYKSRRVEACVEAWAEGCVDAWLRRGPSSLAPVLHRGRIQSYLPVSVCSTMRME